MSQVEQEEVCGEFGYRCGECTHCARHSCIVCGDAVEEYQYAGSYIDNVCLCCTQNNEEEVIADDLEGISELKRSGGLCDYDAAIEVLTKLMLDYSHRTERYGLMDIAPDLMDELIQLRDECFNEGYMECSECGDTMANNKCEFVDEEMNVCMCMPCATTFRQERMKAIEEWQTKKMAELFGK